MSSFGAFEIEHLKYVDYFFVCCLYLLAVAGSILKEFMRGMCILVDSKFSLDYKATGNCLKRHSTAPAVPPVDTHSCNPTYLELSRICLVAKALRHVSSIRIFDHFLSVLGSKKIFWLCYFNHGLYTEINAAACLLNYAGLNGQIMLLSQPHNYDQRYSLLCMR